MPEINLEAEQVVEEEEERAPSEGRGGGLKKKKGVIIIAAIVVVEALVLFLFFSMFSSPESHASGQPGDGSGGGAGSGAPAAQEEQDQGNGPLGEFPKDLTSDGRIALGKISITEDNLNNPKMDRRVGVEIAIQVTRQTYDEIMAAMEIDKNALELVKDALGEEIRIFLLGEGIAKLKSLEVQLRLQDEIQEHLLDRLPQLRGKLTKVYVKDVNFSRY